MDADWSLQHYDYLQVPNSKWALQVIVQYLELMFYVFFLTRPCFLLGSAHVEMGVSKNWEYSFWGVPAMSQCQDYTYSSGVYIGVFLMEHII